MTFLEARRAEADLEHYRVLALAYWDAIEPIDYGSNRWMAGRHAPDHHDTDDSRLIRREIATLQTRVEAWAGRLHVAVHGQSAPPPAVGGYIVPYNLLSCVIDQNVGYHRIPKQEVIDAIDRCIGAANAEKRRAGFQLLKPWHWLVAVPAVLVGWPFQVMRKAGVPDKIVESTGAQVLKALMTVVLWLVAFGWAVYQSGLAAALQNALPK